MAGTDERLLRSLFDNTLIGIVLLTVEGRISYANSAYARLLGRSVEEMLELRLEDFIVAEDVSEIRRNFAEIAKGTLDGYRFERRYIHKDGTIIHVQGATSTLRNKGKPPLIVTQIVDITAKKEAERKLAQSEERWAFALESAHQGVWDHNLVSGETYFSPTWKSMLGYGDDEVANTRQAWIDLLHPDDREKILAVTAHVLCGETDRIEREFRMRHKNGSWVWILSRGRTIARMPDGKAARIIGTHTDITSIKSYETQISRLHERLDLAISAGRIGVWDYDLISGTPHWDDRLHEIYGTDTHHVSTLESWIQIVHPQDRPRVAAIWADAQANRDHYEDEFRIVRPDGEVRHIHSIARIFKDAEGRATRVVGANWDITEQKRLNEKVFEEKERLGITLASIADAVICTDGEARITFMNPVAEKLTGWSSAEAAGQALPAVFHIIDETTGDRAADPVMQCLKSAECCQKDGGVFLVSRTGGVSDIQMSAAPVRISAQASIGSVLVFRDITEAHARQKKIAHSALHDALTGLPNRSAFLAQLNDAIGQARQEQRSHALCFVDLDHFKQVNDRAGHAAGDALLQETAKIIALSCSKKDVPARLGGDEFALLIRDCKPGEAEATAERIIAAISRMEFRWEMEVFRIGASIGATMVTAASPELSEILHQADKACYAAKASGRNRVCIYGQLSQPQIDRLVDDRPSQSWLRLH
ncbi:PAS domain S-box protein [Taklimakanibacter deserti]|uniref:PAS domain S-box protein n=1 Tax=Taklimakanibacter deserti TaxID=2267839 RepID=UPI000E64C1A1